MKWSLLVSLHHVIVIYPLVFLPGITLTGLEPPLRVGQIATISCMINIAVDSIEWSDESSVLNMSTAAAMNLTVLAARDIRSVL